MKSPARFACVAAVLCLNVAGAYTPPPTSSEYDDASANVFLDGEVTRVDITIAPEDFQAILDDPESDEEKHATVRWRNSVIDETHTDVGFRARGGVFTRPATRKSWKIDFNDFVAGRSFHGLESVDLNGDHNDATFLRRRMAHEILRQMGLPSPRTHFVALYINDAFWSIQIHTEHVDEEFADVWFNNKDGNLFKCRNNGTHADLIKVVGEDYKNLGGGGVYEETNNDPDSDYTDLRDLIRAINDLDGAQRFDQFESYLNVDNWLRYIAVDVATGSWDDYWNGSNNYFLYHNTKTNRFEIIPYDYDNTFGIDYFSTDWSTRSFENWGNNGFGTIPSPMVEALFQHSPWRRQYRRYLLQAAALLGNSANQAKLDAWHAQLLPYFDGTIEDGGVVGDQPSSGQHSPYFTTGVDEPANYAGGSDHTMGIKPFMNARASSLNTQISNFVSPTTPSLKVRINEVVAGNAAGPTDPDGDHEDFIELYNDEESAVDLSGWYLSDDVADPLRWQIPNGTTIASKGYLVIWADNEPTETGVHATYVLGLGGQTLGLFMNPSDGRVLVDYLTYPALSTDQSFGRFPDGSSTLTTSCTASPGTANVNVTPPCDDIGPRTPPALFVNEFMAQNNSGTIVDEVGDSEDWIEIYNAEATEVDLGGLYLTDDLASPTKWMFPDGTTIPAGGFLLIWCDSEPLDGRLHAMFKLSTGGEAIGLFDNDQNDNQPIHTFTFGAQTANVTQGLYPDGVGPIVTLDNVTPGYSNVVPTPTPSPSPSPSPSASPSPSPATPTASPTPSPTNSPTPSPATPSPTNSPSLTPTVATATPTPTPSATPFHPSAWKLN
ncbi:CotH kinase family protein [Candidatus Sumerlaeota bacterium]|nr:CotH kinase family protein [Candidatus Sumerlaeota bacterium]